MPSLLDIFPGITVTANEIAQAEVLSEQVLQSKFENLDLREGTAIRDLVIRPSATLLAMINKASNYYFSQNTIAKVDDETSTDMVDSLMSNWFLYRNLGSKATINARLFFARSKNISLTNNTYFSTDGKLKFFPLSSTVISSTQLSLDTFQNEYYYDITLIAEAEGVDYNLSSGSLLYFSSFDPYFLHGEINYLSSEAGNVETNTQFITRGKNAISTRNNINNPSIISNIQALYSSIPTVLPVGYGDPEMMRDQVRGLVPNIPEPILTHIGGCVDVYCRTKLSNNILQLTTDAAGIIHIPGASIDVTRSSVSGGELADTLPLNIVAPASTLTSSGMVATYTSVAPHGFTTGDSVTITGATPDGYNGTYTITVTDSTHFTYGLATSLASPATGTISSSKPVPYTVRRNHESEIALIPITSTSSSLTSVSTLATFISSTPHQYITGEFVSITGATPSGYNGTFQITVTSVTEFTYVLASALASPATGTITVSKGLIASGTTISVWAPYHGFKADRYVTVSGADQSAYNGNYLITETTRDTFNYAVPIAPGTSTATTSTFFEVKQIAYNYDIGFTDINTITDSTLIVDFTSVYPNKTVSMNVLQFIDIDNVQGYLTDPAYRVIAASLHARGMNLYYLTINIVAYNGPSPDASVCFNILNDYVSSLQPGDIFVMSDALAVLKNGGINNIQTPLGITFKKYTRDLILPALTGTIVDALDPYDRTSMFYIEQVTTNNSSA